MESIEKGCKWFFPILDDDGGIDEKNMTDSDEETLKGQSSIAALVRESIQNSMDVHDDSGRPVVMEFRLGWISNPKERIPEFLKLKKHIVGSRDYNLSKGYSDKAHLYFDPMIDYFDEHIEKFPYLCVADYNTLGMDQSRFIAFRDIGASFKPGKGAGGSYGIGKAAYFMTSIFKTILVSSMYSSPEGEKSVVFKGFSKLSTNMVDGIKYYHKGHYTNTKAIPITDSTKIPEVFSRSENGTSMFIMGVDDSPESRESLFRKIVDSVVKNFWLAILEEKLIVKINIEREQEETLTINKEELARIIMRYDEFDRKYDYTSPRPYYEAYSTAEKYSPVEENPSSVYFEEDHEEFGKIRLYLMKNDQKHDRIIKMRSPRMFVTQEKFSGKRGFNGVLLCDDRWNELLINAEPPAHDSWDEKRIHEKKIKPEEKEKAIEALRLCNEFVCDCISKFFHEDKDNEEEFFGIKDLLYTDKDLDSDSQHKGSAASLENGEPSDNEGEFGIATTKSLGVDGEELTKVRPIASATSINHKKGSAGAGDLLGRKRKKRIRRNNDNEEQGTKKPGTDFPVKSDTKGIEGHYREIFNVRVSCFLPSSQNDTDPNLYTMVIIAPKKIEKAMVEITTGAALGTLEVPLSYSSLGNVDKNRIKEIPLEEGTNILQFKFSDNISHSIKVATYEFK